MLYERRQLAYIVLKRTKIVQQQLKTHNKLIYCANKSAGC